MFSFLLSKLSQHMCNLEQSDGVTDPWFVLLVGQVDMWRDVLCGIGNVELAPLRLDIISTAKDTRFMMLLRKC